MVIVLELLAYLRPVIDISDKVQPIIKDEIFYKVQERLDDNKKRIPKRKNRKYKYAGLLRCSCGSKITANVQNNKVTYVCPKSKNLNSGCDAEVVGRKTIREEIVEQWVNYLSNNLLRETTFHKSVLDKMIAHVARARIAQGTDGKASVS